MKQTAVKNYHSILNSKVLGVLILSFVLALVPFTSVYADTFSDQINQLQAEADQYKAEAGHLRAQADTLQNEIAAITAQQRSIEIQIVATETQLVEIGNEIENTELRITNVKQALGENLRSLYVEGDVTPIEMVASSNSISDYIDKQEARNKINQAIGKNIKKLGDLKTSLAQKKVEAEQVLIDQQAMEASLAEQDRQKNTLLNETQGQESAYQELVKQKNSAVEDLRAQQRAANLKAYKGSIDYSKSSAYPWPNASMSYNDGCEYPDGSVGSDDWGYCFRQCTSYVAWKLAKNGASGFSYLGHAGSWAYSGQGIPTREAKSGDVLVLPIGSYGHVMYVEGTTDQGVFISEFNYSWDGRYSERIIPWGQIDSQGYKVRRF